MLKRAEPPICVGLYARWGSGKTFMISLLKKEFDPTMRADPKSGQLLQSFEKGYKELEPKKAPAKEKVSSLICDLLVAILFCFLSIPRALLRLIPYWVTTVFSITYDAFNHHNAHHAARDWCSRFKRACTHCAKTAPSGCFNIYQAVSKAEETNPFAGRNVPSARPKTKDHEPQPKAASEETQQNDAENTKTTVLVTFLYFLMSHLENVLQQYVPGGSRFMAYLYKRWSRERWFLAYKRRSREQKKEIKKECIFVDFNAWTCAACVHNLSFI